MAMGASTLLKLSVLAVLLGVAWRFFSARRPKLPPVVEGFFLPEYRPVADLFRKYVEDGTERGGSFSVYRFGEPLVDLWGGYADAESYRPWREDTVTIVWSVTKGASALCLAMLVERGLLDYKAEVRKYWPEFDQNGKGNITVGMLVSHQGGLVNFGGESLSLLEYKNDWQKVEKMMAESVPVFPPGSNVRYHSLTFGMYVDALIRRVDPQHRNLTQFFHDEVAVPFGIDFQIGLPYSQFYRISRVTLPTSLGWLSLYLDPSYWPLLWAMTFDSSRDPFHGSPDIKEISSQVTVFNDPILLNVGIGSMMGFATARSVAKMYSILANGGTFGNQTLLAKPLVDKFSISFSKFAHSDVVPLEFSRGFMLGKNIRGDTTFGHPGYGGQQGHADPKNKLGVSYVTNFMFPELITPPGHCEELMRVFYDCFEKQSAKETKQ